jgi:hypothetical protein
LNCREASELAIASTRRRLETDYRFGDLVSRGRRQPPLSQCHEAAA